MLLWQRVFDLILSDVTEYRLVPKGHEDIVRLQIYLDLIFKNRRGVWIVKLTGMNNVRLGMEVMKAFRDHPNYRPKNIGRKDAPSETFFQHP